MSGSAIGFYGNTGTTKVDEHSSPPDEFMSDICQQWEAAISPVKSDTTRLVNLRTGVVLSTHGGALAKMLLPFKLGLGGKVGTGQQYMSVVTLPEYANMIDFLINTKDIEGPVNLVSQQPITNHRFANMLAKALSRPAIFPLPAFVAKIMLGEMAEELLLASNRVVPTKLIEHEFSFDKLPMEKQIEMLIRQKL